VIIVDSGDDRLSPAGYSIFTHLPIQYLSSPKSVCIQRNIGIQQATGDWIFLCDDDIEVPVTYLQEIAGHIQLHPEAGAISGQVLQKEGGEWKARYPVRSRRMLWWNYIFQLSIWGEIECTGRIADYYKKAGNHLSKAGWPVITDFTGDYFITPVYGLGASVVKREWLLQSPYEELLDRHGIGDNYGVAMGFPVTGIHVLNTTYVYHHQEPANRLQRPLQYMRRVFALHYFINTKEKLRHIRKRRLLWSLIGNLLYFIAVMDGNMSKAAFKSIWNLILNRNPYLQAAKAGKQTL
jgi:glycosyltransferase involved in cell wall biosynthesis